MIGCVICDRHGKHCGKTAEYVCDEHMRELKVETQQRVAAIKDIANWVSEDDPGDYKTSYLIHRALEAAQLEIDQRRVRRALPERFKGG